MAACNHVTFVGNVGRDLEERTVGDNMKVCTFSLAVDEGKDKEPLWLTLVGWRKLAEQVKTYVKKGTPVLVAGRLSIRKYMDKQQVERQAVEVIASDIRFLGAKPETQRQEEPAAPEPIDPATAKQMEAGV
jgi:single-strand DNA-binding protein